MLDPVGNFGLASAVGGSASSGGGNLPTAAGTLYEPFAAPATPNALDAEFITGILPLAEFDIENAMTYTVDDRGVILSMENSPNSTNVVGLLQELPVGYSEFTIECHTGQYIIDAVNTTYVFSGLMLTNGNAANSQLYSWAFITGYNIEHSVYAHYFTDYKTFNSVTYSKPFLKEQNGYFLRIRKDATNYYFDYSLDGRGWLYVFGAAIASFPFTPTHFGLMMNYTNGTTPQSSSYSFLRYKDSDVGHQGHIGGRRINYYVD